MKKILPIIKKVRKILFESSMHGEWWIDDSGFVEYADGDIGDKGHAAVVAERLMSNFLDYFDIHSYGDDVMPLSEHEEDIIQYLINEGFITVKQAEEDLDVKEEAYKYLVETVPEAKQNPAKFKDGFEIAWGNYNIDPREYGMRYLGMKRVVNNWVQTMTLTKKDIHAIAKGIGEIMDQNGEEGDEPLINIEVLATRRAYVNIPLDVIKSGNISSINKYRDVSVFE